MGFRRRKEGPLSGNYLDYDNIDEKLCEINIWLKYIKFGFWRPTDQTCYHIWNGYLKRGDAVKIVNELQDKFPKEYFEDFCASITSPETSSGRLLSVLETWTSGKKEGRLRIEVETSVRSTIECRKKPFEFYPCIFCSELPIDFGILGISGFLPSQRFFFTSEMLSIRRFKHCPVPT